MKNFIIMSFFLSFGYGIKGQSLIGINFMPALEFKEDVYKNFNGEYLLTKIKSEIIHAGMVSSNNSRFVVLGIPNILNKQNNGQILITYFDLDLSVMDLMEGKTYKSISIPFAGVGSNEEESLLDGIKRINLSTSNLSKVLKEAAIEIDNYFKENCSSIIEKARISGRNGEYQKALGYLEFIPSISEIPCKRALNEAMVEINDDFLSSICHTKIQEAQKIWSLDETNIGIERISALLALIPLNNECKIELDSLLKEIKEKIGKNNLEAKALTIKMQEKQEDKEHNQGEMDKELALAYYKSLIPQVYIIPK